MRTAVSEGRRVCLRALTPTPSPQDAGSRLAGTALPGQLCGEGHLLPGLPARKDRSPFVLILPVALPMAVRIKQNMLSMNHES